MRGLKPLLVMPAATAIMLAACSSNGVSGDANNTSTANGQLAQAPAVPLVDSSGAVIGEVQGGDSDRGAVLLVKARGLPPGEHGIHIHEIGLCEPPDFKSAGPHWNPTGAEHGSRNPNGPHMGDLQNVTVGPDGTLEAKIVVPGTYLRNAGRDTQAGAVQILDASGAAIVIHAKADDYSTDPSGNSGDRIACAALGAPEPGAAAMLQNGSASASGAASGNSIADSVANTVANEPSANSGNSIGGD